MYIEKPILRMPITQRIKQFIIDEREKAGMSATELARAMGRPQSWIAQIENGRTQTVKHKDFIAIFMAILKVDEQAADNYLILNSDKFKSNNLKESVKRRYGINNPINENAQISIFKDDENEDNEQNLKEEFDQLVQHLEDGLGVFFDNIDEKQDALDMIGAFLVNLHCDMGFTLSVAALPLCRMERTDTKVKTEVFKSIADLIRKHGLDCSADGEDENNEE